MKDKLQNKVSWVMMNHALHLDHDMLGLLN